jgi:CRISPR-associated protein Csy3
VVSDGAFFNLFEDGKQEPLHVMYHGIRGTQNVAGNKEKGQQQVILLLVKSPIFN